MGLMTLVCVSILTGCITSWIVVFSKKFEISKDCTIIGWLQIHGSKLISELASCDFCLNWWLSCIIILPVVLLTGEWVLILTLPCSTMIGRFLSA